jgi:hypothetical protein
MSKGGGIIISPLLIENPTTMATNTFGVYFASPCPICGLFFTCNNLVLISCGCTYHPFCLNVPAGGKDLRKCASQKCGPKTFQKNGSIVGVLTKLTCS